MEIITIDNINYISGDYILSNAPIYCKGYRSSRDLIRQKKIDPSKYIYARYFNNTWIKTEGKSVKFDKVIIKEEIIKTIPELNKSNNNEIINDDKGIENAPNIIHLNDNEKFRDEDNNILEIETRGERKVNNIYFKVKDVSDKFNINHLYTTILDNNKGYNSCPIYL